MTQNGQTHSNNWSAKADKLKGLNSNFGIKNTSFFITEFQYVFSKSIRKTNMLEFILILLNSVLKSVAIFLSLCKSLENSTNLITHLLYTCKNSAIKNTRRRCELCSKLAIKTWRPGVFIVNFEHISYLFLVFL